MPELLEAAGLPFKIEFTLARSAPLRHVATHVTSRGAAAAPPRGRAQCRKQLDEAKQLDPAGESAERVQRARKEIQAQLNPESGVDKK